MTVSKNIFIIAGEASGDQHAASYVKQHLQIDPHINFTAIGQQELKKAGAKILYDSEKISVVGIIEVLVKYRLIKNALDIAYKHIKANTPDLIILVDYVEFNMKIAKFARGMNIPILFYIAPQVWAWREKRIKNIIKLVDHIAVVFPFEEILFQKYTKSVTYVGHPLADDESMVPSTLDYNDKPIDLGIFPGSRESEIKNNLFLMIDLIKQKNSETLSRKNIKIFYANITARNLLSKLLPKEWEGLLASGKDLESIKNCKKAITASGTITLELALMNIPMIIMYRLSPFTYFIMKSLIKLKYIGLVNLILGDTLGSKPIVKEYVQPGYSDEIDAMVELRNIDNNVDYRKTIEDGYSGIRAVLNPGASAKVAQLAEKMLE